MPYPGFYCIFPYCSSNTKGNLLANERYKCFSLNFSFTGRRPSVISNAKCTCDNYTTRYTLSLNSMKKGRKRGPLKSIVLVITKQCLIYISPNDERLSPLWKVLSKEETQNCTCQIYRRIAFRRNEKDDRSIEIRLATRDSWNISMCR